jgi:uridine kinase
MRAGESMEVALREVCKDTTIGKLLIQTDAQTGSPTLIYAKLPRDIQKRYVLLMDPTIGTGATAMMAVRILLDHDVPEDHILFLTLIAAPQGLHTLAYAFPQVRIVTTSVDKKVNSNFFVLPGVGNFGDRYFGTE